MYDIIFISYNEPNAEQNYSNLYGRFNYTGTLGAKVKRVDGVKGIHQAHVKAAEIANTNYFYVVDGDAVVDLNFKFNFIIPTPLTDKDRNESTVFVYKSVNPINDLVYGYGGVKILPKHKTLKMDTNTNDMTTSISKNFKVIDTISNITAFNTDPFNTWKSAFRECAKLASTTIERQNEEETNERLKTWTTVGHDRQYGEYALAGATAGMEFGLSRRADLGLINNFEWLQEQFDGNT